MTSLKEHTQSLMKKRPRDLTLKMIERETKLRTRWLQAFVSGEHSSYCVDKVQRLYEHLSGKSLPL